MSNIYNSKTCPEGKVRCHVGGDSQISFPEYNTTIDVQSYPWYLDNLLRNLSYKHNYNKNDIVIINFGLHYNGRDDYNGLISRIASDIKTYYTNESHIQLFYL